MKTNDVSKKYESEVTFLHFLHFGCTMCALPERNGHTSYNVCTVWEKQTHGIMSALSERNRHTSYNVATDWQTHTLVIQCLHWLIDTHHTMSALSDRHMHTSNNVCNDWQTQVTQCLHSVSVVVQNICCYSGC